MEVYAVVITEKGGPVYAGGLVYADDEEMLDEILALYKEKNVKVNVLVRSEEKSTWPS
jgi:hypothetical protein